MKKKPPTTNDEMGELVRDTARGGGKEALDKLADELNASPESPFEVWQSGGITFWAPKSWSQPDEGEGADN